MGKLVHGCARRGAHSPAFKSWRAMMRRCQDEKFIVFENYGGRGIKVCERWQSFENFLADMGERPDACSIDRIDPDGDYEPGNCRWATRFEQNRNQRPRKLRETCRRGHPFTPENTYVDSGGSRSCRKCRAACTARARQKETA